MATEVIERTQPAGPLPVAASRVAELARRAAPAAGLIGLIGTVACGLIMAADALAAPSFVSSGKLAFGAWPSGFLSGIGSQLHHASYGRLTVGMFLFYLLAVAGGASVRAGFAIAAVVLLHLAFMVTPPLGSRDIFNYLDYARLGALHGMNPYTHVPRALSADPLFPAVGWPDLKSPYGPLYTVVSYVTAPLGIGGGLWALKAMSAAAAGGCLALVWRLARRLGRPPAAALVLVGLNPAWLVWGVGGGHNDFLMILLELVALTLLWKGREGAAAGTAMLAAGFKVPALLLVPMVVAMARDRRRAALGALAAFGVLVAVALVVFGGLDPIASFQDQNGLFTNRSLLGYLARLASQPLVTNDLPGPANAVLAVVVVACIAWAWRTRQALRPFAWATAALILAMTWEFPWYVAWLLPFAALIRDWKIKATAVMFTAVLLVGYVPLDYFLA